MNLTSSSNPSTLKTFKDMTKRAAARKRCKALRCNICGTRYSPSNKYQRFCSVCRQESELYRNAEWMPVAACWI